MCPEPAAALSSHLGEEVNSGFVHPGLHWVSFGQWRAQAARQESSTHVSL